ncbi:RiPP maturation radical SAM C-methyltransferase [Myxococcus sp. MISCRS1]|uniref:RiPP maturation radical SAM C-methyltransferase n=1 Tax=Myxococcus sp. MISCRS1 TaxID=2996786 RepID=UPI00226F2728|nr:RiPP maturation radical SAM C-methyltransferase [Myxococcus sp. MISCRS1]MCY1003560.1 RiPP maturation radical SAM C-methyltransferase [Myxococcus sp. MISCRS1]
MRIGLVALPWSLHRHPSSAMGALSAYLRQQEPTVEVECRSAYLEVANEIGLAFYDLISQNSYEVGEMLYTPCLFPQQKQRVRDFFVKRMEATGEALTGPGAIVSPAHFGEASTWEEVFDTLTARLEAHLDRLADALAGRFDVVGLTTCFGQLFANLSLCQRIKQRSPATKTLLGGSTISNQVGPSLLKEFDFLDYIIQGEGEQPLLALVRQLREGQTEMRGIKGVISRATAGELAGGAQLWEVPNINALPLPDYDEYARKAEEGNLLWFLTIEGSRGCWWDRAKRTGNPKATCFFCNLNVQWNGYREKSAERVVTDILALNGRYQTNVLFFLDNIIRAKGIEEFADRVIDTGKDFVIFYEMRASVRPYELLRLWEAGVRYVQFGIEGLSNSYLKRIGKGTSVIANLQAMKVCHELGILNSANLLTDFPGARQEEVEETTQTILDYALLYTPLNPNRFWLGRGATIDTLSQEYGLSNIRNADFYKVGLPEEVYQRISLLDLSYDSPSTPTDWSSVYDACRKWGKAYAAAKETQYRHLLTYLDSGDSMRLYDTRSGMLNNIVLRGLERDVYMACMEIQRWEDLREEFIETGRATQDEVAALLGRFVEQRIVYQEGSRLEGSRFLSLAPAYTAEMATRRIRRAHEAAQLRRKKGTAAPRQEQPVALAESA